MAPSRAFLRRAFEEVGLEPRPYAPFAWRRSWVSPRAFCLLIAMLRYLRGTRQPEPALVELASMTLLQNCLPVDGVATGEREVSAHHLALCERVRAFLDLHYDETMLLPDIAGALGYSMHHLARVFRAASGSSIQAYRDQLRLRESLRRLDEEDDLSRLAVDLGYSSHSHFTARFRSTFGLAPSHLRDASTQVLGEMVSGLAGELSSMKMRKISKAMPQDLVQPLDL